MSDSNTNIAQKVAKMLLEIEAIKLQPSNPFTWASGLKSPIYCDNRISLSYPKIRNFLKENLSKLAVDKFGDFDKVAGVATAGIAHGALLADYLEKPFIYVRSKAKAHGRQNLIEGRIEKGEKILVVEDLISTGKSSIAAVEAIKEENCEVLGVVAIFSYGFQKALDTFSDNACKFYTLSNYNALLEEAISSNYITTNEKEILADWNNDPSQWSERFQS